MKLVHAWFATALWKRVVAGMVCGLLLALLWPAAAPKVAILGELFVRLIRMLVVPIVFISIASGITALGDTRKLGSVGLRTVGLFALTTFAAVAIGMTIGILIEPGAGANVAGAAAHELGTAKTVYQQLVGIVPLNILQAMVDGDMLAILFAATLLGAGVIAAGEAGKPVAGFLQSLSAVLFQVIRIVMEVTPFGVFALIAGAVAANGLAVFTHIGLLAAAVAIASLLQMALVHAPLIRWGAGMPVPGFFRNIADALAVAFSTASSSATLPVALRVACDRLKIDRAIASTTLPLGASSGKDGTAMYVGLLSVFALQAFGVHIDAGVFLTLLFVGALTAFGTAPIPSASLFMLTAVLPTVGVTPEQTALLVGFILPFDRLLDMTRTVPSACANLTVCTIVARMEGAVGREPASAIAEPAEATT